MWIACIIEMPEVGKGGDTIGILGRGSNDMPIIQHKVCRFNAICVSYFMQIKRRCIQQNVST